MLLKVLFLASAVLCYGTSQAYINDYSRYHVAAGRDYKGYGEYPVSPFPIVTHPHSAQKAAMQVQVRYQPSGVGAPWGTLAPAKLTKPPPALSYGPIPAASYLPRYQPGAKEAGLIPESHPQHKGDYGYGRYGSDERYEPGYGPLPQLSEDYSHRIHRSRYGDYSQSPNIIPRDYESREYATGSREYAPGTREYATGTREYATGSREYAPGSREYGRDSVEYGRDSEKYERDSGTYGRDSVTYGRDSGKYGRDSGTYGRDSGKYERDSGKYEHKSQKYDRDSGTYGRDSGKYGHDSGKFIHESREYGYELGKYGQKSGEYDFGSTVHGPDSREFGHPQNNGRSSRHDLYSKANTYDSREYSPVGYGPLPMKGEVTNGHSYHLPQKKGNSWEVTRSSEEHHYTSRPYGPDKPIHGPWNHPGFHRSYTPPKSDPQPPPIRPWIKSASREAPAVPDRPLHVAGPPDPLSSFHVVDSIGSRPKLNMDQVKNDKDDARPKSAKPEPQRERPSKTEDMPVDAKALEDDGSGDEEQVWKSGKEDEKEEEEENDSSLPPDCKGMSISDPKKRISPGRMALMCRLYKGWGKDMKSGKKWKPTQKQDDWFSSLGSHNGRAKRSKRQAVAKALRKEYRALTDSERASFHAAMNALKTEMMDGTSKYDLFVNYHRATNAPGAHFGAAFLPWHREMTLRFENALREINDSVSLPYWDSNLDHSLGELGAQSSIIWTDRFFGNGKGDVTTGPFKFWRLAFPSNLSRSGIIYRNLTVPPPDAMAEPRLMSDDAVLSILEAETLRNITWFVDSTFETHHGSVHNWVGGVLADLSVSPSDPVFFLHHAFIDCLWEQMRIQQRLAGIDTRFDYPNDTVALGVGERQPDGTILDFAEASPHYALAIMQPFRPLRNIDGLADEYFDEFYDCAPSPFCTTENEDCGSQYLFCERATFRCLPRLTLGATCAGFAVSEPCFDSVCCRGRCRITCDQQN